MDANERRTWLMSISEDDSFKLAVNDWYDRIRFLREEIGHRAILEVNPTPTLYQ